MKRFNYLIFIIFLSFFSCNKEFNDNYDTNSISKLNDYISSEIKSNVYFNGNYLEFKSEKIYDSIRNTLDQMEYVDFEKWENNLGFKSACSWKNEFENLLNESKNSNEYELIKTKYSKFFTIDDNNIIKYNFYASSLDRILNINGFVKIGKSLYKFTNDNEYISYDGNEMRIENANEIIHDNSEILGNEKLLFDLKKHDNLKSSYVQYLKEGVFTIPNYRRLIYSLQKIVYSSIYAVDINTGALIYQWGYGLNLTMRQYGWLYALFNGRDWRTMSASYYVRNVYIDWGETGVNRPFYVGNLSDKNFSLTSKEVKYWFVDVGYRDYYVGWGTDFSLNKLHVEFYSSGIGVENKIIIDI
jgi:hypothetical protein